MFRVTFCQRARKSCSPTFGVLRQEPVGWRSPLLVARDAVRAEIYIRKSLTVDRHGIAVRFPRKSATSNSLEHGIAMEQIQAIAGHNDVRTTQLLYRFRHSDAKDAARHIQIQRLRDRNAGQ